MMFDGATTDPIQQAVRDALIAFMAAMAEAAGGRHQRGSAGWNCSGKSEGPGVPRTQAELQQEAAGRRQQDAFHGAGASAISKATGLTRQAVLRIRANPVDAERALKVWGM